MTEAVSTGSSSGYVRTRRWVRYKVDIPIRVIVCTSMKATIFDCRGTTLSKGGMALFAGTELKPGDLVAVEFTPPYGIPPIRVDARVCNRNGYTYGVEFVTESSPQKRAAAQLRRHLSTFTEAAHE